MNFKALVAAGALVIGGAACGNAVLDAGAPGTAQQAALSGSVVVNLSPTTINEGQTATVEATQVCANTGNPVTATIDWGAEAQGQHTVTTRTITPTADANPAHTCASLGFNFIVCDPAQGHSCVFQKINGTVTGLELATDPSVQLYLDNNPLNAPYTVNATFDQPLDNSTVQQGNLLTVLNVAPQISSVNEVGGTLNAEGVNHTFHIVASDPGLANAEIKTVAYHFTPVGGVANDSSIGGGLREDFVCTCANALTGECVDGTGAVVNGLTTPFCAPTPRGGTDDVIAKFLDDRGPTAGQPGNPYSLSVAVTDHDNASASTVFAVPNQVNTAPQNAVVTLNGASLGSTTGTALEIEEGLPLAMAATFQEDGTDQLTLAYDNKFLGQGAATAPTFSGATLFLSGTTEVTKASYFLSPAAARLVNRTVTFADSAAPDSTVIVPTTDSLNQQVRFDDGSLFGALGDINELHNVRQVSIRVADDDLGVSTQQFFIKIKDVNPINNTLFVGGALPAGNTTAVTEGDQLLFDAGTLGADFNSGDHGSGFDPLAANRWRWKVKRFVNGSAIATIDDLSDGVTDSNAYTIIAGCAFANKSCTLRFNDDDALDAGAQNVGKQFVVFNELNDEDSFTKGPEQTVNVNNFKPFISLATVNGATNATTVNEQQTVAFAVTFNDAVTLPADDKNWQLFADFGEGANTNIVVGQATTLNAATLNVTHQYTDDSLCTPTHVAPGSTGGVNCAAKVFICEGGGDPNGNAAAQALCSLPTLLTVTVKDVAPTVAVNTVVLTGAPGSQLVEGKDFDFDGNFNDVAGTLDQPYNIEWTWLDGDGATARLIPPFTSNFTGNPTSAAVANVINPTSLISPTALNPTIPGGGKGQNITFNLKVTDDDNGATTTPKAIFVRDDIPTVSFNVTLEHPPVVGANSVEPAIPTAHITVAPETDSDKLTQLDIDWGDGTVEHLFAPTDFDAALPGTSFDHVKGGGTGFAYPDSGVWHVTMTIHDEDSTNNDPGGSPTAHDVTVLNANPLLSANPTTPTFIQPAELNVGTHETSISEGQAITVVADAVDLITQTIGSAGGHVTGDPLTFRVTWGQAALGDIDTSNDVVVATANGTRTQNDFDANGNLAPQPATGANVTQTEFVSLERVAHVYPNVGSFHAFIEVRDDDNAGNFCTDEDASPGVKRTVAQCTTLGRLKEFKVNVVNIPPVLTDVFSTAPVFEGETITTVGLVDNRGNDVLTYSFNDDCQNASPTDADFTDPRPGVGTSAVHEFVYADDTDAFGNGDSSPYTVCIRVCDDDNQLNSCVFGSTDVEIDNADPTLTLSSNLPTSGPNIGSVAAGGNVILTADVNDIAGSFDPLTVDFDCTDDAVIDHSDTTTAVSGSGIATFTCNYPSAGTFTARVRVTDDEGGSSENTLAVRVTNVAPVVNAATGFTVVSNGVEGGAAATFSAAATDSAGDSDTLQIDVNNDGVFDVFAPFVAGTATSQFVFATSGSHIIREKACDAGGLCSAYNNATVVVVNAAPTLVTASAANVNEGTPSTYTATGTDPGSDALTFQFDTDNNGSFETTTTTGTVTVLNADGTRPFAARVCDSDAAAGCSGGTIVGALCCSATTSGLSTTVANVAPVIVSVNTSTPVSEGSTGFISISATDAGNDALTLSAVTFSKGATTINGTVSGLTASSVTPLNDDGTWAVNYTIKDTANAGATQATLTSGVTAGVNAGSIVVTNVAPSVTSIVLPPVGSPGIVAEGTAVSNVAYTVSDAGGVDTVTVKLDCDDDGVAEATHAAVAPGTFTDDCHAKWQLPGTYVVRVTVTDNGGSTTDRTATVHVNNVAPVATAVSFLVGTDQGSESTTVTKFHATASDAGLAAGDNLTLQIDANNAVFSSASTTAAFSAGGTADATFQYATSGVKVYSARVCDSFGACTNYASANLAALNVANVAPTLDATAVAQVNEGEASVFTFSGHDPGGDALTFQVDLTLGAVFSPDLTTTTNTATKLFAADGDHAFKARVCDSEGACSAASAALNANVQNVAPVISSVTATPANEGSALTATFSASDAGNDALTFVATFSKTGFANVTGVVSGGNTVTATLPDDGGAGGLWNLALQATDTANTGAGGVKTTTVNTNVVVLNVAPTIVSATATTTTLNEGGSGGGAAKTDITVNATDPAGANDPLTVTLQCFDSSNHVFVHNNVASGVATTFTGAQQCGGYNIPGNTNAVVTVDDGDGGIKTANIALVIVNQPPLLTFPAIATVNQGQPTVITASATDNEPLTISFDTNGDNTFDVSFPAQSGTSVSTQVILPRGTNHVNAKACDSAGLCSVVVAPSIVGTQQNAVVNNVAPVLDDVQVPSTAITGSPVTFTALAHDVGNDALTYTFVVKLAGANVFTPAPQVSPSVSHSFTEAGAYTVDVTVSDGQANNAPNAAASPKSFIVTDLNFSVVANANPVSIHEGDTSTIHVELPTGNGTFDVKFDLNDDGQFDTTGAGHPDEEIDNCQPASDPTACDLVNHVFAQNRPQDATKRIAVVVIDHADADAVLSTVVSLDVTNVAPVLDAVADGNVDEEDSFTTTLTATDVGVQDTETFSLVDAPAGALASVDPDSGLFTFNATFNELGNNDFTVRVTDSDGASDDQQFSVFVNEVDSNGNGISDGAEEAANNGSLICSGAACTADVDNDGVDFLHEVLDGTDPTVFDGPTAPTIVSPDNGVAVTTAFPTLTVADAFSPRGNPLKYTFDVFDGATHIAHVDSVVEGRSTTSVTLTAGDLVGGATFADNVTYRWNASANDTIVDGPTSADGTFVRHTTNTAPPASDPVSPADAAAFPSGSTPTLESGVVTDDDGNAVTYTFVIEDSSGTVVDTSPARTVPFFTLDQSLPAGTYTWHVTTSDGTDTTDGADSTFTIDPAIPPETAPDAPVIVSPNNTTINTTTVDLTITAATDPDGDTVKYEFEYADNAAFANATASGVQAGTTFSASGLAEDSTVFWRVRSNDGRGLVSDFVNAQFVVDAENAPPVGLALVSPSDGALLQSSPSDFVVQSPTDPEGDAVTITVDVATDKAFANIKFTQSGPATTGVTTFTPAAADLTKIGFTAGTQYFWRATASDGTNSVIATGSFTLFKAPPPPAPPSGGCGCNADQNNGGFIGMAFGLVGLAVIRRRRR